MTDAGAQVAPDPADLPLDALRALRHQLQHEDDCVSYARRVAQARLDLVASEHARRAAGTDGDLNEQIGEILGQHLTGGPARPPRPTDDLTDNPLADELESVCAEHHFGRLTDLDDVELAALSDAIGGFEQRVSADRRERFARLDALSAELVRRYRDGEADVDTLLTD